MKKIMYYFSIASICLGFLVGCNDSNSSKFKVSEKVKIALDSLKGKSHEVFVSQSVSILRPYREEDGEFQALDIKNSYEFEYGYYYNGEEKSYSEKTSAVFADLDKETGEPIQNSIRTYSTDKNTYFKAEDGTVYSEHISLQNEIYTMTQSYYDEDSQTYKPLIFDSEFKNPFDYITYRDIKVRKDGSLTLINRKADFLGECYKTVGMNFITDNTIELDDEGRIIGLTFVINDLVEENYTRKNEFEVVITGHDSAKLAHLNKFNNDNSKLQSALEVIKDKNNFTYNKEIVNKTTDSNGNVVESRDYIEGYFTEDVVYFHHRVTDNDNHPYQGGDNYDYKAVKQKDGEYEGKYLAYEYTLGHQGYEWGVVMLSASSPYVLDSFEETAPAFMNIDASIFRKIDEYTYEIEPYFLSTIGQYFDYGMYGVDSQILETKTTKLVVNLDENFQIESIESGFLFSGIASSINYYLSDIDTTVIPSWAA